MGFAGGPANAWFRSIAGARAAGGAIRTSGPFHLLVPAFALAVFVAIYEVIAGDLTNPEALEDLDFPDVEGNGGGFFDGGHDIGFGCAVAADGVGKVPLSEALAFTQPFEGFPVSLENVLNGGGLFGGEAEFFRLDGIGKAKVEGSAPGSVLGRAARPFTPRSLGQGEGRDHEEEADGFDGMRFHGEFLSGRRTGLRSAVHGKNGWQR